MIFIGNKKKHITMRRFIILLLSLFMFYTCIDDQYATRKEDIYGNWNVVLVQVNDNGTQCVFSKEDVSTNDDLYSRMTIEECYVRFYKGNEQTPCKSYHYGKSMDNLYLYEIDDKQWEHPTTWKIYSLNKLVLVLTNYHEGCEITYKFEKSSDEN